MDKYWLVLFLLVSSAASACSFDCAKAKAPEEKAICASPELCKADEQLAAAYADALSGTPPTMTDDVRADQRAWLNQLAVVCTPTRRHAGKDLTGCLLGDYKFRINQLQHLVLRKHGVTFVWRSLFLNNAEQAGDDDLGILSASWPEAASDETEWKRWNKAIEAAAQSAFTGDSRLQEWQDIWATGGDFVLTTTIDSANDQWIATTVEVAQDTDWHPIFDRFQFTWILRESRELHVDDVFKSGAGWQQKLQAACAKSVQALFADGGPETWNAHQADYFRGAKTESEVLNKITEDPRKYWLIGPDGLTIVFLPYGLVCDGCGLDPITIPWAELKPYLNATFVVPQ